MAGPHLKQHAINDSDNHLPGTNGTLLGTESNALAEKAFGPSATGNVIVQRQASGNITLPATDPVANTDAASKGYVDAQIVSGVTWKELVLAQPQLLNGASGGILQGILAAIATNPADGDTFIISDGSTTETFTFRTVPAVAFDVLIGGSAAATTTNLVSQINTDSTLWSAVETDGLDAYFSGTNDPQLVVHRTAISSADDRIYGTIAGGQSGIQVVEFATGNQDYREDSGTQSDLPAADPAAKRFGFGRAEASVNTGDTHRVANDNTAFTWDGDDQVWQNTDTGSTVTEGDGIDVTGGKVSTDVAAAVSAQQYGGIVNNRTSDGSGAAAADAGFLAVQTDDSTLEVNASNQVALKAGSPAAQLQSQAVWESTITTELFPSLAELNAALGSTAGDIGNAVIMVERSTALGQTISAGGAGGVGSTSSFWALKVANAGALADYQLVEMTPAG